MNQINFRLCNEPNEYLLMDVNLHSLYQNQKVRLLNRSLPYFIQRQRRKDLLYF